MNNMQVASALYKMEERLLALEGQGPSDVAALQDRVTELEGQIKVLVGLLGPKCFRCGESANHKERILHGGCYSDMWVCDCSKKARVA